jgi:hypothetical protein
VSPAISDWLLPLIALAADSALLAAMPTAKFALLHGAARAVPRYPRLVIF